MAPSFCQSQHLIHSFNRLKVCSDLHLPSQMHLLISIKHKRTRPRAITWDSSRLRSLNFAESSFRVQEEVVVVGAVLVSMSLGMNPDPLLLVNLDRQSFTERVLHPSDLLGSLQSGRHVFCSSPTDYPLIVSSDIQSTLMSKLTGTHSEVSEIDFTTLTTVPGTVKVHGAPIQILDLRESSTVTERALIIPGAEPKLPSWYY